MTEECEYDLGDCDNIGYGGYSWGGGYGSGSGSGSYSWGGGYGSYGGGCAPGCWPGWPGDNICDQACMTEECEYDLGDCDNIGYGGYSWGGGYGSGSGSGSYSWGGGYGGYGGGCAPGCWPGWPG